VDLLFVGTANVCRSPIAERLALAWARQQFGGRAHEVSVASAGVDAWVGEPINPHSAAALVRLGGDPSGATCARSFTPELARQAALVLTMTRLQRHSVLAVAPRGLRRTFTLLEAFALMGSAELDGLDRLPIGERAAELGMRLDAARAGRTGSGADDVEDPLGRRMGIHLAAARTIAEVVRPLTTVLYTGRLGGGA
jgi:protein-tyrosine phosphatase